MIQNNENLSNCVSQKRKAKLKMVARVARLVRAEGLDYEDWRYVIPQSSAEMRPMPREETEEAAASADRRRIPPTFTKWWIVPRMFNTP